MAALDAERELLMRCRHHLQAKLAALKDEEAMLRAHGGLAATTDNHGRTEGPSVLTGRAPYALAAASSSLVWRRSASPAFGDDFSDLSDDEEDSDE